MQKKIDFFKILKCTSTLKPPASAQSKCHAVCHLLDPWQIKIYHISDYSCNIFLFILHNILYTGNEFEPIYITNIFLLKISYKLN